MIGFKSFENFKERQQLIIFCRFLDIIMQVRICLLEKATQYHTHTHMHAHIFPPFENPLISQFNCCNKGQNNLEPRIQKDDT